MVDGDSFVTVLGLGRSRHRMRAAVPMGGFGRAPPASSK